MLSLLSPGDVETDTSALGQLQRGPPKALLVLRAESHQQEFETSGTEDLPYGASPPRERACSPSRLGKALGLPEEGSRGLG